MIAYVDMMGLLAMAIGLGLGAFICWVFEEICRQSKERSQYLRMAEFDRAAEQQRQKRIEDEQLKLARREDEERAHRKEIVAKGLEDWDEQLRQAGLTECHLGRVFTVRVFSSPTGRIVIEWMLDKDLRPAPQVVCYRDEEELFVERAHEGRWSGRLNRGEEYKFSFAARDGSTNHEDSLRFTITIPTEEEWLRRIPGATAEGDAATQRQAEIKEKVNGFVQEEQAWDEGRQMGYMVIEARPTSDAEKRRSKAALDAKILKERETSE